MCGKLTAGSDKLTFGRVDVRVVMGIVAEPPVEGDRPHETQTAKECKCVPPRHVLHQRHHEQRSERAAPPCKEPDDPLGPHFLFLRKPDRKRFRNVWKTPGFAHPEKSLADEDRGEVPCPAGGKSEEGPPKDNA